jgi:hypothetical protein
MARVRSQRIADPKNLKDPDAVQRALRELVSRWNDLSGVLDAATGQTYDVLRGDLTWGRDDAGDHCIPSGGMHPSNDANWTKPVAASDYWTINAGAGTGRHLIIPLLGLRPGMRLTTVQLEFQQAGATPPGFTLRSSALASSTSHTPTVAWSAVPAAGSWTRIQATYDLTITSRAYQLVVAPQNNGDLVRACFFRVT